MSIEGQTADQKTGKCDQLGYQKTQDDPLAQNHGGGRRIARLLVVLRRWRRHKVVQQPQLLLDHLPRVGGVEFSVAEFLQQLRRIFLVGNHGLFLVLLLLFGDGVQHVWG